ncbi:glutaredoxin family protein [Deinococcus sp. Arct2-2]|uniref:glutaredoxin family protein n=1 Tax=Deinococcus sp. Arct2-2 TaxID=2568653 RepID=UPI0010A455ED|nr:glutaredoxin family protein [Deinococcus sp. Arct2-2]THF71808.1 glutaredoxin family protein [Deinococcus sp. Arct2-2]
MLPDLTLPDLTLYSRPGCHLCEQAHAHLLALDYRFAEVDITSDAELERLYGDDIPVLAAGNRVLIKGVFSKGRLSTLKLLLLREARERQSG